MDGKKGEMKFLGTEHFRGIGNNVRNWFHGRKQFPYRTGQMIADFTGRRARKPLMQCVSSRRKILVKEEKKEGGTKKDGEGVIECGYRSKTGSFPVCWTD